MKRLVLIFFLLFASTDVLAVRVKDLVEIQGVRENRLAGYGLVVGLNGTCLLYTSDAADELTCVDLGGRRIIKKKKQHD